MKIPLALRYLRAFYPSWRFFEKPAAAQALSYRAERDSGWTPCPPESPRRGFFVLFFNPRGNLALACHGLVDQLLSELDTAEGLDRSVSYELVRNLVASRVRVERGPGTAFRFRVTEGGEELLVSAEHEA